MEHVPDGLIEMRARDGSRVLVGANRLAYHREVEGCLLPEEYDAIHAGPKPAPQEPRVVRAKRGYKPSEVQDPFPPIPGEGDGA
jgi:hypothetical protein